MSLFITSGLFPYLFKPIHRRRYMVKTFNDSWGLSIQQKSCVHMGCTEQLKPLITTVTKWNMVVPTRKSSLILVKTDDLSLTEIVAIIDIDWKPHCDPWPGGHFRENTCSLFCYMVTGSSDFSVQQNGEVPVNHVQLWLEAPHHIAGSNMTSVFRRNLQALFWSQVREGFIATHQSWHFTWLWYRTEPNLGKYTQQDKFQNVEWHHIVSSHVMHGTVTG